LTVREIERDTGTGKESEKGGESDGAGDCRVWRERA
jgi:hypothetical protein